MKNRESEEEGGQSRAAACSMASPYYSLLSISFLLLLLMTTWQKETPFCVSALNLNRVSELKLARIQGHVDNINKPAVRSIQSLDGDIIDCVPAQQQLALEHPLLKNHKIQTEPPEMPRFKGANYNKAHNNSLKGSWQAWHHKGHCPKETVPIRRTTVDDVLRAKSLYQYGKKKSSQLPLAKASVDGNGHEHAIAYTGTSQEVYGAKATINVWDPSIDLSNEFSLSQVWVLSGSFNGDDLNSIEAGWQVSPELYGDSRPRLFTYWTSDAYQATGCYNHLCPGFVQTSNKIAIGASISPVSSYCGSQFDVTILIWKDPKLGNWWLSFGDNMLVGYWPAELFTHLSDHATMVEWGGEVVNMQPNGAHTSTQMGSGHFASDGFSKASYFRNIEIVDSDNSLSAVETLLTLAENTNCYNILSYSNADWGTYFYYGGPGQNPLCP